MKIGKKRMLSELYANHDPSATDSNQVSNKSNSISPVSVSSSNSSQSSCSMDSEKEIAAPSIDSSMLSGMFKIEENKQYLPKLEKFQINNPLSYKS
jgi:hypothetical protein